MFVDRISIIVPVYNVKPYLEKCIKSLMLQTYRNIEIILIDDGSTDGSGEICDYYKDKYPRIIVIRKENGGVSSARNIGLQIASGDYIGFVDPDDYIDSCMYEELYNTLKSSNADVAACMWQNEHEDNNDINIVNGLDTVMASTTAIEYDLSHGFFVTWNKLFSRKVCGNVFYDEDIINGEDRLYNVTCFLKADKVVYVNKPYYHYVHRNGSAGTKKYSSKDFSLILACKKINKLLLGKSLKFENICNSHFQSALMQIISMMKYDVNKYDKDGRYCLDELRKMTMNIVINPYNDWRAIIKALIIIISPKLARWLYVLKSIYLSNKS